MERELRRSRRTTESTGPPKQVTASPGKRTRKTGPPKPQVPASPQKRTRTTAPPIQVTASPHKRTRATGPPTQVTASPQKKTRTADQAKREVTFANPEKKTRNTKNRFDRDTSIPILVGYEKQRGTLVKLLQSTLFGLESNSVVIIGPRGCGKSTLVNSAFKEIAAFESKARLLQLDGFIHREEDDVLDKLKVLVNSTAESTGEIMLDVKDFCEAHKQAVVVILNEFDQFCRKSQMFLYNLFDVSQKTKYIFVIGITCRIDCLELLEKRVRSRMNQTILHLYSPFETFEDYLAHATNIAKYELVNEDERKRHISMLMSLYSIDRSPRTLEMALLEFKYTKSQEDRTENSEENKFKTKFEVKDVVARRIADLSHQELLILTAAFKFCKVNRVNEMHARSLFSQVSRIPNRVEISKKLQHTLICNLIQAGLFIRIIPTRQQANHDYLNDWTILQLGFHHTQLKEAINATRATIPSYLRAVIDV